MGSCEKCLILRDEVIYLREQNKTLMDRLVAISSPTVYSMLENPKGNGNYFGDGQGDQYRVYDDMGQAMLVEKLPDDKQAI